MNHYLSIFAWIVLLAIHPHTSKAQNAKKLADLQQEFVGKQIGLFNIPRWYNNDRKIKVKRFNQVWGNMIKVIIEHYESPPAIAEIGVYNEK